MTHLGNLSFTVEAMEAKHILWVYHLCKMPQILYLLNTLWKMQKGRWTKRHMAIHKLFFQSYKEGPERAVTSFSFPNGDMCWGGVLMAWTGHHVLFRKDRCWGFWRYEICIATILGIYLNFPKAAPLNPNFKKCKFKLKWKSRNVDEIPLIISNYIMNFHF